MTERSLPAFVLAAFLAACGAEPGADAPLEADVSHPCPSADEMAPTVMALLREERLPATARLIGETLPKEQLTAVLDAALRILRSLPGDELNGLFDLLRGERVRPVLTLLRRVLDYAQTSGPGGGLNTPLLDELADLLRRCASEPLFATADALFESDVLHTMAAPLREAMTLPVVQSMLSATGALNRQALADFIANLEAALVAPGADPGASLRQLLATLAPLTDLLSTPPLSTLVDALAALLAPTGPILPPLQGLLCCHLYGVATCPGPGVVPVPREAPPVLVYLAWDLLLSQPAELDPLLALLADPALTEQIRPLAEVLHEIGRDADLRHTIEQLLITLLRPEIAGSVLPELGLLLDPPVFDEVVALASSVVESCAP